MQPEQLSAPAGSWSVRGRRWAYDDGRALEVYDPATDRMFRAEGVVRDAVLRLARGEGAPAALVANEAITTLAETMRIEPAALGRADVLRGSGYELLFVELGARCNERCEHCYAESSPERDEALTRSEVVAILDDARTLGFESVQFTGGDPLLHPDLVALVGHARSVGFAGLELFTNGLALSVPMLDALAPHGVAFAFSVYADVAEVHDAVTGVRGSHARTMRAIERVLGRGLAVRVGITATARNATRVEATRRYLAERGVPATKIRVSYERSVGRGHEVGPADSAPSDARGAHGEIASEGRGKACVTPTGDVIPCIFGRHVVLGNIRTRGLAAVLTDPTPVRVGGGIAARADDAASAFACPGCRLRAAFLGRRHALPTVTT